MDSPSTPTARPGRGPRPPPLPALSTSSIRRIDTQPFSPQVEQHTVLLDAQSEPTTPGTYESAPPSILAPTRKKGKRVTFKKRLNYYIPSTYWIPNYSLSFLGGDILAGITMACLLVPQSVSYATSLATLSPVSGLYSAAFPAMMYALFGTCRQLNVAPEAALSLMVGQAVAEVQYELPDPHGDHSRNVGVHVATVVTLQAGLITFLLGFLRLGFIDVILSRALLRGFITAIAVVIMVEQLISMFGLNELKKQLHPVSTLDKFVFLIEKAPGHYHGLTAIVSFGALAVLVSLRTLKSNFPKRWYVYRFPEVLFVVILSTWLSYEFDWVSDGIAVLGKVSVKTGSNGFFDFPVHGQNWWYLKRTTPTAVLISIVGFLDSIVAAKSSGARYGYSVSGNRELVALGVANIFGSFVPGTLPAYGSITRTRINGEVGMKSQMGAFIASALILLTTFFLLRFMETLPTAVLASVIVLVVFSLLSEMPHDLWYYIRMRAWVDLSLMGLTFIFSIVWDVEVGIVCSMIISLVLVVHRSSKPRMTILGRVRGSDRWKPINENLDAEENLPGVLIVRIRDNLDFANTAQLKERLRRLERYGIDPIHPSEEPQRNPASVLVFHLADCERCDASATQILLELFTEYADHDVSVFITHTRHGVLKSFRSAGILDILPPSHVVETVAEAVAAIENSRWPMTP